MQDEIEAKFINIDIEQTRSAIKSLGGVCTKPMRTMRRATFHNDYMLQKGAYARVRDEGDRVTVTYKQIDDANSIHGVREVETVVEGFDTTVQIFEQCGLQKSSYQETRREVWTLADVEIMIDEWPWLSPFIEIEGPSEESVRAIALQLGQAWDDRVLGTVDAVYLRQYPKLGENAAKIVNRQTPLIRFQDPVPKNFGN